MNVNLMGFNGRDLFARVCLPLLSALVFGLGTAPLRADVIVMDDMLNPLYSIFSFNNASNGSNPDDLSSAGFTPLGLGGNSGPYLEVLHEHDVQRDGNGDPLNGNGIVSVQSFLVDRSQTYTPSTDGAIRDITFSLDILFPVSSSSTQFDQIFFILENANIGQLAGFTNIAGQAGWQTITVSGLTNADFSGLDFNGVLALSAGFGFISSGDVAAEFDNLSMRVDNFTVSVNAVPEPCSVLGCLALTVIGLLRCVRPALSLTTLRVKHPLSAHMFFF